MHGHVVAAAVVLVGATASVVVDVVFLFPFILHFLLLCQWFTVWTLTAVTVSSWTDVLRLWRKRQCDPGPLNQMPILEHYFRW